MSRRRHPDKTIETALRELEAMGWTVSESKGRSAHAWGFALCPLNDHGCRGGTFCRMSVWSTPRDPACEEAARQPARLHLPRTEAMSEETFEFDLVFALPADSEEDELLDRLFEAGLDDAVIGLGTPGLMAISLERSGADAETVITEAARTVAAALPAGSELREVRPDLVSQAGVAARLGVTRQALQKRRLPPPSVAGLYRADELYPYLAQSHGKLEEGLRAARAWFRASDGAKRLNAKIALGEVRFGKTG